MIVVMRVAMDCGHAGATLVHFPAETGGSVWEMPTREGSARAHWIVCCTKQVSPTHFGTMLPSGWGPTGPLEWKAEVSDLGILMMPAVEMLAAFDVCTFAYGRDERDAAERAARTVYETYATWDPAWPSKNGHPLDIAETIQTNP